MQENWRYDAFSESDTSVSIGVMVSQGPQPNMLLRIETTVGGDTSIDLQCVG